MEFSERIFQLVSKWVERRRQENIGLARKMESRNVKDIRGALEAQRFMTNLAHSSLLLEVSTKVTENLYKNAKKAIEK